MRTRILPIFFLVVSLCGSIPTNSYPYDDPNSRESIRGIKEFKVGIHLPEETKKRGLDTDIIQNDVELRLRQKGILVTPEKELAEPHDTPLLIVSISTYSHPEVPDIYSYTVLVSLYQKVKLLRNNRDAVAETWSYRYLGMVGRHKVADIRDVLKDCLDTFINAYFSVNPKK